jgi:RNA polymerase sigma-70 factor, ECF subfamily
MSAHPTTQADDSRAIASAVDGAPWLVEHGDALYRYARSRVGDRELAEDLVQDAFLAALESRDRFQGRATVRTWLLSILRHKIVDHYRRVAGSRPIVDCTPRLLSAFIR